MKRIIELKNLSENFTKHFIRISSGFSINPVGGIASIDELSIGYMVNSPVSVERLLFLKYQTGAEHVQRIHEFIRHIFQNLHNSLVGEAIIYRIIPPGLQEISNPKFVTWAHTTIKKYRHTILEEELPDLIGPTIELKDPFCAALFTTAICSGTHKTGFSLRQIAAQYLYHKYRTNATEDVFNALRVLFADTTSYYSFQLFNKKTGMEGGEAMMSVPFSLLRNYISEAKKYKGLCIKYIHNLFNYRLCSTDMPDYSALLNLYNMYHDKIKVGPGEYEHLVITATEQFGPGLFELLIEKIMPKKVSILYTSAVFLQRLILHEYLTQNPKNIDVKFYLVSEKDLDYTRALVRGLLKDDAPLVLLTGNLALVLAIASKLPKDAKTIIL